MHVWKTGRITLFDVNERPVAEVAKVKHGWVWYVAGSDLSGDSATSSEAMTAVEQALKIDTSKADVTAR